MLRKMAFGNEDNGFSTALGSIVNYVLFAFSYRYLEQKDENPGNDNLRSISANWVTFPALK